VSGYGYHPAFAFLSVGFRPLPSGFTFYGNTFRLSDRSNCLLIPFGFCTLLQLRGRSALSFRHLSLSFNFGIFNHSEEEFSIYSFFCLSIFRNYCLKLNQQLQPSIEIHFYASIR
jgi:hypothetical protein